MRLTVVRHGQTIENREHIIQGQNPGRLSAQGIEQALEVAKKLSARSFDVLYSSDLTRCVKTANIIRQYHPELSFSISPKIREMSFGTYQGKPSTSLDWQALEGTTLTKKAPGGESWTDVSDRVIGFMNEIYTPHIPADVLVVTHGGPMRVIRAVLQGMALDRLISEQIPNCAIWELEMVGPITPSSKSMILQLTELDRILLDTNL